MSNLHDLIRQRRSIRKFQPKQVPTELVVEVLEAAGWAPSAHNSQPWRFIVLRDPTVRRVLAEKMANAWAADLTKDGSTVDEAKRIERRERFANAPVLILACLTMDGLMKFPDLQRQQIERDLGVESLSAGLQNLLLAAHNLGLGACWYCAPAFCKETVRDVLKIPAEVEPAALIVFGYPAETPLVPPKKGLSDYCFADLWGKSLV
jgi:coenzyme F420-0:L-glutamate ligase / coenzyme F420-1:gamma-L-glutamate ligase